MEQNFDSVDRTADVSRKSRTNDADNSAHGQTIEAIPRLRACGGRAASCHSKGWDDRFFVKDLRWMLGGAHMPLPPEVFPPVGAGRAAWRGISSGSIGAACHTP